MRVLNPPLAGRACGKPKSVVAAAVSERLFKNADVASLAMGRYDYIKALGNAVHKF